MVSEKELKAVDSEEQSEMATLLVVDDSKLIRKSAHKMLGKQFEVLVAENGEMAWDMIQKNDQIKVIFSDLDMPQMDGYKLLELIRTHEDEGIRNLPMIIVTGAENDEVAKEKAFALGATDFITKPFNSTDIKARAVAHASYQRRAAALKKCSNLDESTGLVNRQGYIAQIEKDWAFVLRHEETLALMLLELDDFKTLFLKIGRRGMDAILNQLSSILQNAIRKEDTLARIGVAQFALSLPTAKHEAVKELAQRVCDSAANFKVRVKGELIPIAIRAAVYVPGRKISVTAEELLTTLCDIQKLSSHTDSQSIILKIEEDDRRSNISALQEKFEQLVGLLEGEKSAQGTAQILTMLPLFNRVIKVLDKDQRQQLFDQLVD